MRLFRPFGVFPGYWTPVPADFQAVDQKLVGLINAVDGGTWSPAKRINIGGAGWILNAAPKFTVPQTRVIRISPLEAGFDFNVPDWNFNLFTGAMVPGYHAAEIIIPLPRFHNGARLLQAKAFFTVNTDMQALPASSSGYPCMAVQRIDPDTAFSSSVVQLRSGSYPSYLSIFPVPSSLNAYINGGAPNVITYTPNQNNDPIDTTNYFYNAVFACSGTLDNSPNNVTGFLGMELTFDKINDLSLP